MRLSLSTWDSHAINDVTNYEAVITPGNAMPSATANFIDMGQGNPILSGKTLDGGYFTFHIVLRGNIETQRDELNKWFRPNDFVLRKLVALDLDNSSKDWYLEGYPVTPPLLADETIAKYSITLALSSPYWIEVDLNTNTWSVTADTETEVMANVGNVAALPKFAITPIQAKASNDLKYKTFYAVHTSGYGATKLPVDITAGALDTATLIGASKMQADGDDLGVSINGVYVDRWFGNDGINDAHTGVWVNMNFTPAPTMTLSVALNDSTTPATILAVYTLTGGTSADGSIQLPQNSTLQIDSELITYSSYTVDAATKTITFVPVLRAAKGSTIAAHTVGDSVYWIENEVWLTYGNASAATPVVNDNYKPIIDLTTSTNSSWAYLLFGDSTGTRAAAPWYADCLTGEIYTGNHSAAADPYTEMGWKLTSWVSGNSVISRSDSFVRWRLSHPGGISNIVANGENYRVGSAWANFKIRGYGTTLVNGTIFYTEPTPTDESTWEAVTIDQALAGNPTMVDIMMNGGLGTTLPLPTNYLEFDDVTLAIASPPTITVMGVEQVNYKLSGSLKNNTTGDTIVFNDIIGKTAQAITIDCDTQEIYSADGKRLRGMISFSGTKRDEWITLESGNNSIIFADTGTTEVTIVTTWRGRNTI